MQRLFILAAGLIIGVAASGAVSSAAAKTIKIFNTTHYAVVALQPKKPTDKEWQRDLLGEKALGVGKLTDVDFGTTTDYAPSGAWQFDAVTPRVRTGRRRCITP